jgi:uncharacterized protein (DUF362 family)/Ni,Fe-hydrogenase III small subunit
MNTLSEVSLPRKVALVRYEESNQAVRRAVALSNALAHLPEKARVFIKPNIVFWSRKAAFPKWGVVTTSRVVEDVVELLKEKGVSEITVGEGTVTSSPKDFETAAHAFETLGYNVLKKRYGVKTVNVFERPFHKVDLGEGVVVNINADALESDFIVNLPVLKTHAQTVVSLGIKNLKGLLDITSRKEFHSPDPVKDLHYKVARLANWLPPSLTLLDGIFTLERGPGPDGLARRTNILAASPDIFSADKVGAVLLGYAPSEVPHLVHAAHNLDRPLDLSDIELVGEKIEEASVRHAYLFPYAEDMTPQFFVNRGIKGVYYRKYDSTMCTYCSNMTAAVITSIARAWQGTPWDEVEILTGKAMEPMPGRNYTILLGKCMYERNKNHPHIKKMISVKGCPPPPKAVVKALHQAGIKVDPAIFDDLDATLGWYMKKYQDKPEFDERFFRIT